MAKNNPNSDQNRKTIALFRSFSRAEMEDFCHFTKSAYFNTDEKLAILAKFLHKIFWAKKLGNFDVHAEYKAYVAMFGKTKSVGVLDDKERAKLNDKLSRLTKLGIQYLSVSTLKSDSSERIKLLLDQFSRRKLPRFFEAYKKKEQKRLTRQKANRNFYLNTYQLERSIFEYQFTHDLNTLIKSDNLERVIETLDVYYLVDRMLLQLAGIALMKIGMKSYDFQSMQWIIGLSELPQYKYIPAVQLCLAAYYMESYRLQSAEDVLKNEKAQQHFTTFSDLLSQHSNELSRELNIEFYTLAVNFCTDQVRLKNLDYHQKGFELCRDMESAGLWVEGGGIRAGIPIMATTYACRTANFEWAEMMLHKYENHIDSAIRNGVCSFISGQIAFYRGNFEVADKHFFETEQQSYHRAYSINSRIFRLKCLYELKQFAYEAAKVRFNSEIMFRKNSQTLAEKSKKSQINFIRVLMDLYKIRDLIGREHNEKINERLQKVNTKIKAYQYVTDVPWLNEKLTELLEQVSKK